MERDHLKVMNRLRCDIVIHALLAGVKFTVLGTKHNRVESIISGDRYILDVWVFSDHAGIGDTPSL